MNKEQKSKILSLLIGKNQYTNESDLNKIIEYFEKYYINPLKKRTSIKDKVLLDVSCGFGWMVFAFLKQGGKFAYGVDIEKFPVESSKKIARILKLDKKCKFSIRNIEKLRFKNKSMDIFSSIETLEHVKNQKSALNEINRVAKEFIIIATPNGLFPKDTHNSGMFFGNYFPKFIRRVYMKIKKKEDDLDYMTKVMNPFTIEHGLKDFEVVSKIHSFNSLSEWVNSMPYYSPYIYGRNKYISKINKKSLKYKVKKNLYIFFGSRVRYLLPKYCVILQRNNINLH